MATITRRTLVGATAALAVTASLPTLAMGQDAATPDTAASLPLASLGLPELAVTITNDGITLGQELTAGTSLLTVSNQSDASSTFMLVQPPAEITTGTVEAALEPGAPPPDWLHQSTVTGSFELAPGQTGQTAIELLTGDWYAASTGELPNYTTFAVAGEFVEIPIEATVAVVMSHHRFEIPTEVAAGPQVWQITNEDEVLHHMIVFTYPEAISTDQVLGLLMASEGMASPPAGLDPMLLMPVAITGLQSLGVTTWSEMDLAPGYYQAACFISDPGSEVPHAVEGMIATLVVA